MLERKIAPVRPVPVEPSTEEGWWPKQRRNRARNIGVGFLLAADVVALALSVAVYLPGSFIGLTSLVAACFLSLVGLGAYRPRLTWSVMEDLPALSMVAILSSLAEQFVPALVSDASLSGQVLVLRASLLVVTLATVRAAACWGLREAGRRGVIHDQALILGTGEVGRRLAEALLRQREYGLTPVGFLDDEAYATGPLPVRRLGGYGELAVWIKRMDVRTVIVAYGDPDSSDSIAASAHDTHLVEALRTCDRLDCEIYCVPRFHELHHRSRDMDEIWGVPLVRIRRAAWRTLSWRAKRMMDVACAAVLLLLLSPLMLAIAAAASIECGTDPIFRQLRVGLDGRPFTLLKFRSLRLADASDEERAWSLPRSAHVGRVGKFLRATSLDELPQLINVLKGEMSIVGPRPERLHFVEEFARVIPGYSERHRIPAGLTGWSQVNGLRGDTSIEERARFDNYYIQNWSLWLDLQIVVRTVGAVVLRRGS